MASKAELRQFKQWQRAIVALDASDLPALPYVLPLLSAVLTTLINDEQSPKRQKLDSISFGESSVKKEKKPGRPKKSLNPNEESPLPSPVITPSPTPKKPPPTVDELVALWQENIESDIRDKVFSSRWRRNSISIAPSLDNQLL